MGTLSPQLTAIGFYDGPIEGFVRGIEGAPVFFFKVVAWDEGQNRRLYMLGKVDEKLYEELLAILTSFEMPSSNIWTPAWKFADVNMEVRANRIVDSGRRSLEAPVAFALGENLLDAFEIMTPTDRQLKDAKNLVRANWPGNLNEWLALG